MDGGTNKTNNMQYIKQILTVFSVGLILFTMYTQNEKINQSKTEISQLKLERDSLQNDLFITKTTLGRYELSVEYLKEKNPNAFKQFDNYLSSETE